MEVDAYTWEEFSREKVEYDGAILVTGSSSYAVSVFINYFLTFHSTKSDNKLTTAIDALSDNCYWSNSVDNEFKESFYKMKRPNKNLKAIIYKIKKNSKIPFNILLVAIVEYISPDNSIKEFIDKVKDLKYVADIYISNSKSEKHKNIRFETEAVFINTNKNFILHKEYSIQDFTNHQTDNSILYDWNLRSQNEDAYFNDVIMKIETFIKNLLEHNPVHQLKKELIEYIIEYHNNSLNKKVLLSEIYDLSIVDYYSIKADVSKYCSFCLKHFKKYMTGCGENHIKCYCGCKSSQHLIIKWKLTKSNQISLNTNQITKQERLKEINNFLLEIKEKIKKNEEKLIELEPEYASFSFINEYYSSDLHEDDHSMKIDTYLIKNPESYDSIDHTILFIGEAESGKTCLIQSLVNILENRDYKNLIKLENLKTIEGEQASLQNSGFKYYSHENPNHKVQFIDTPGFDLKQKNLNEDISFNNILSLLMRFKSFNRSVSIIITQDSSLGRKSLSFKNFINAIEEISRNTETSIYVVYTFHAGGEIAFNKNWWENLRIKDSIILNNNIYSLLDGNKQKKLENSWNSIKKKIMVFKGNLFKRIEEMISEKLQLDKQRAENESIYTEKLGYHRSLEEGKTVEDKNIIKQDYLEEIKQL